MATSLGVIINENMKDGQIAMYYGTVMMNKATHNKIYKQSNEKLNKKQSKFSKFIVHVLYKIDDGLLIMYYKTKFKPFETMGAYVGGLGNKMNKEME